MSLVLLRFSAQSVIDESIVKSYHRRAAMVPRINDLSELYAVGVIYLRIEMLYSYSGIFDVQERVHYTPCIVGIRKEHSRDRVTDAIGLLQNDRYVCTYRLRKQNISSPSQVTRYKLSILFAHPLRIINLLNQLALCVLDVLSYICNGLTLTFCRLRNFC